MFLSNSTKENIYIGKNEGVGNKLLKPEIDIPFDLVCIKIQVIIGKGGKKGSHVWFCLTYFI